jgi:hypothetical protein
MIKKLFTRIFNILLTILILIYLILEELIWDRIADPIYRFLHRLKILQHLEEFIQRLNRYTLLALFLLLFVAVELLGVFAIALIAQGLILPGILLYAGKIPIAAFTFWLFRVAQDKLLTFTWFKFCYGAILTLINNIKTSRVYLNIKTKLHAVKIWVKTHAQRIKLVLGFKV